jgi:F0F1-type ATP synthase membrane subunit c/vacuolar-type H+-ATPase subunit K
MLCHLRSSSYKQSSSARLLVVALAVLAGAVAGVVLEVIAGFTVSVVSHDSTVQQPSATKAFCSGSANYRRQQASCVHCNMHM